MSGFPVNINNPVSIRPSDLKEKQRQICESRLGVQVLTLEDKTAPYAPTGNPSYVSIPATPNVAIDQGGGSLAAGTYYYAVTALNYFGETIASVEVSAQINTSTGKVTLSWIESEGARVEAYRIYRGTTSKNYTSYYTLSRVGASNQASWSDNGTRVPQSSGFVPPFSPPTVNTAISPGPESFYSQMSNNIMDWGCGRVKVLKRMWVETKGPCKVMVRLRRSPDYPSFFPAGSQIALYEQQFEFVTKNPNGATSGWIDLNDTLVSEGTVPTLYVQSYTQMRVPVSVNIEFFDFTDSPTDGDLTMLIAGDSLSGFGMGSDENGLPYVGKEWLWHAQIAKKLAQEGINVKVINKAKPATMGTDGAFLAKCDNYYDGIRFDVLFVFFGMNDASQPNVATKVGETYKEFIRFRNRVNPDAPIIFIAPTQSDEVPRANNLASVRTQIKAVATDPELGGNARQVFYYDGSKAFSLNADPTQDLNMKDIERMAGKRVHMSGRGQTLLVQNFAGDTDNNIPVGAASGVWEVLKKTKFYLKHKK